MQNTIQKIIHVFKKLTADSKKQEAAFTLMETLIYIALFAILSVFLINTLLLMFNSYTQVRVNNDLMDASHVSMERLTREIRGSISSDTTTAGVLKLNTTDASGNPETEQFDVAGSALELTVNSVLSGTLTGGHVSVTSLVFRTISTVSGSAVRIEMTIQSLRSQSNKSISITDTIALRGSY